MFVTLGSAAHPGSGDVVIQIQPGGGAGSIGYGNQSKFAPFGLNPNVGDQIKASIYYDQHGHTVFTATDLTQGITRTAALPTAGIVYNKAALLDEEASNGGPPATDVRLWQVTGARMTTYTGARGTVTGPWQTGPVIQTSSGTAAGTVFSSPAGLWNGGANFSVWLRALPRTYTGGLAGYYSNRGPFRFLAADMTVPAAQVPAANGGSALVTLGHSGGPTPRPYAYIEVRPGGGAGSISYVSNAATGTFKVNPAPGDQLAVSIFYDQHGHYSLTVTDTTQAVTGTVTVTAPHTVSMARNYAEVLVTIDNSAVTPPPADVQIWAFTGVHMTTYSGVRGGILGPWSSGTMIDTTTGTAAGTVVTDATPPAVAGSAFSVWLRHQ